MPRGIKNQVVKNFLVASTNGDKKIHTAEYSEQALKDFASILREDIAKQINEFVDKGNVGETVDIEGLHIIYRKM